MGTWGNATNAANNVRNRNNNSCSNDGNSNDKQKQ